MKPSLQESWQSKIDASFPDGCIATWIHGGQDANVTYRVSYIRVTGVTGLDPVLSLYVFGTDRVVSDLVLSSWEVLRAKPHLIVKATFLGQSSPMMFTAKVPDESRAAMAADRKAVLVQFAGVS